MPHPRLVLLLTLMLTLASPLYPVGDALAQDGVDGLHLIGRNDDEFAHMMDFHIVGDYAFASVGLGNGLQTYDISDPTNPTRRALQGLSAWRAHAYGDTIYSFAHYSGVQVFDISTIPPQGIGSYNPPAPAVSYEGGVRVGNMLYVAAHQDGIHALDVTPPTGPESVESFWLSQNACWDVSAVARHLFIANGRHGLAVVDLDAPGGPAEIASVELPGLASDIVIRPDGQVAFLPLGVTGIAAIDISDPTRPRLLGAVATLGNAFTAGLVRDILAVGSYPYLERFDVSDPQNMVLAGWDATKVYAMGADAGVTTGGDSVIVVADWRGMGVYAAEADPSGDIDVYPVRLDLGAVTTERDTTVLVRNTGGAALTVSNISPPTDWVAVPNSFTLDPGETQPVTITATGPGSTRGRIYYNSDDPDEASFRQYVYKNNTSFPQIGSVAPDFTLQGTDGQSHSLSDYLGKVVYLEFGASW